MEREKEEREREGRGGEGEGREREDRGGSGRIEGGSRRIGPRDGGSRGRVRVGVNLPLWG